MTRRMMVKFKEHWDCNDSDGYVACIPLIKMTRSMPMMMMMMMMMMMQCSAAVVGQTLFSTSPASLPLSPPTPSPPPPPRPATPPPRPATPRRLALFKPSFHHIWLGVNIQECSIIFILFQNLFFDPGPEWWQGGQIWAANCIFKKRFKRDIQQFLQGRTVDSLMCRQEDWSKGRIHFCSGWQVQLLSKRRHVICN